MTVYGTTVSADNVKLKYRERYVTEGENERSLAYPSGCYRGFIPEDSTVPDMRIHLNIDPLSLGYDTDSFAIFNRYNDSGEGWSLSIREPTDTVIDLTGTAFDPIPAGVTYLYVYIYAEYGVGQATDVEYRVSEIDPTIADPDIIMIGRIPVTPAATTISFDISVPATWVDVLTPRTYPGPTSAELITSLGAGDKFWGYYDSLSAWRTPTIDEKKAMTNANSPDATNPFATVDETRDLYEAEWTTYDVNVNPSSSVDNKQKIALTGDWYIGNGARASDAARYFRIYSKDALMLGYDASFALDYGGIRPIRVYGTSGVTPLAPVTDSDTEGFYTDPQLQVYMDTEQAVVQEFTIAGYKKKTHGTKAQAPVDAIGFPSNHAQNITIKRIATPPIWGETSTSLDDSRNGLQAVVQDLHKRARGPVARSLTASSLNMQLHKLPATIFHEQGGCDAHPFSPENFYPSLLTRFQVSSVTCSVRKIMPWRLAGAGPKVIVVGLDNSNGPGLGFMDPVTGAYSAISLVGSLPAGTRWMFQDACCDDDSVYVRVADDSSGGDNRVLRMYLGVTPHTSWPTGGRSLGNLSPGVNTAATQCLVRNHSNLINANGNYLAANDQWTDVNGALASVGGVKIIRKSDGVITGGGTGDLISSGSAGVSNPARCWGPIVSDGTNVYFTCSEELSGGGGVTKYHVGMCQIAAPTVSSITGWYTRYAQTAGTVPMDLVFDGYYLWAFGGDPTGVLSPTPFCMVSKTSIYYGWSAGDYEVPDMTGYEDELFGPVCFDGKDIWQLSHNETSNRGGCSAKRISVRQGIQLLSTGSSDYSELVKDSIGAIGPDFILSVGGRFQTGAIAFDGEDIWYSLDGNSDGTAVLSGFILRIPNIKDI